MSELRDLVIEAHGGQTRWKKFRTIESEMSITGMLWARKGWPDALKNVRVTASMEDQELSYRPFTGEGLHSIYRPDEVAIERSDGTQVKSCRNPRATFDGHSAETGWDDLHLAYFSGYAMWNYLTTPFLFLMPGVATEELAPIEENGERRRRLKVTFPDPIATHSPEQVFYIDDNGRIARLDYFAEVTGSVPMAHYTSGYRDFAGIKFPTQRRAYRRKIRTAVLSRGSRSPSIYSRSACPDQAQPPGGEQ
jgi:hypothetical protein